MVAVCGPLGIIDDPCRIEQAAYPKTRPVASRCVGLHRFEFSKPISTRVTRSHDGDLAMDSNASENAVRLRLHSRQRRLPSTDGLRVHQSLIRLSDGNAAFRLRIKSQRRMQRRKGLSPRRSSVFVWSISSRISQMRIWRWSPISARRRRIIGIDAISQFGAEPFVRDRRGPITVAAKQSRPLEDEFFKRDD